MILIRIQEFGSDDVSDGIERAGPFDGYLDAVLVILMITFDGWCF